MENKEELERRNGIIEAYHEGHEIEYASNYGLWATCTKPLWSWDFNDYRIKEEVMEKRVCDIDEQIKVMQAFKDGQKIEVSKKNCNIWLPAGTPAWNWLHCDYRIKEEVVLDCPFCGAGGALLDNNSEGACYQCSASGVNCSVNPGTEWFETKNKALEAWNKRI